jgi:hypothetical protein
LKCSRETFHVKRLLNSAEVQETGLLFPRAFQFDLLSESSQSKMVHVMTAIAIGAAKKLLPKDAEQGASALLKRTTKNATFKRYALPNLANGKSGELPSLKDWVTQYIDKLGRTTMRNAKNHAQAVGPGLRPEFETPVERNRRYGPKEEFLSLWLGQSENVVYSSEIKRLRSGELVKESIKYRVVNGHKGY